MAASLTLERVRKVHPNGVVAARYLHLSIAPGELAVFVGPSGSGKSTALRLIAGLETPSAGRIVIGDRDVTAVPPQQRDIAMVFQSYALYPHMTVRDNLAFGLRMRGADASTVRSRLASVSDMLGLAELLDRRPAELSGGQRQRVALGRAMVREPLAFLLDEPLSNLDPALRLHARTEIARLHRRLDTTMVYVTHDQEEAMTLADRLVVMRDGAIEQAGPPMEVFDQPANAFVAQFVGSPAMNLLPAGMMGLPAPADLAGVRPHDLTIVAPTEGDVSGTVEVVEHRGQDTLVHVALPGGHRAVVVAPPRSPVRVGMPVGLAVHDDRVHAFGVDGRRISGGSRRRS